MTFLARLALISMLALAGGCARTTGDFCDLAKPQRPTAASLAVMSEQEKRDLVVHNELGEERCGWRP